MGVIAPELMNDKGKVRLWIPKQGEFIFRAPVDAVEFEALGIGIIVALDCNTPPASNEEKPEAATEPVAKPPKRKRGRPRKTQTVEPATAEVPVLGNDDNATP